jgi:energy-coupling factor transport system substrate-specific component
MANKYYFSTKDLLLIAILCCLGGVASAYVGYVASTFGSLTGIPMGGQLFSGLHVFWIVIVLAIVDKKGSGALAGLVKGFVEFISGGHLGVLAILTSLLEGVFAEIGFWPFKKYKTVSYIIAGGLGTWANILVTQTLFNSFPGVYLFGTVSVFAFVSGMVLAGYMGLGIVRILTEAGVVRKPESAKKSGLFSVPSIVAVVLACLVIVLLALHFVAPVQSTVSTPAATVSANGPVMITAQCSSGDTHTYNLMDYSSQFVTVSAVNTKDGSTQDYTGLPMSALVEDQCSGGSPRSIDVIASDGYTQTFSVSDVMSDQGIILVPNNGTCDTVAQGYASSMWVRGVAKLKLY